MDGKMALKLKGIVASVFLLAFLLATVVLAEPASAATAICTWTGASSSANDFLLHLLHC